VEDVAPMTAPDTTICPACGAGNPARNKFCNQCGNPLGPILCPSCGFANEATATFCANCGSRLPLAGDAARVATSPASTAPTASPDWFRPISPEAGAPPAVGWVPQRAGAVRVYAGFWRRAGAILIDLAITIVPLLVLWAIVAFATDDATGQLVLALVSGCYYWIGNSLGGTLGKRAVGIRVINAAGDAPGLGQGFLRATLPSWLSLLYVFLSSGGVSGIASILTLIQFLDIISVLWDANKQTMHDKMGGTFVVRA
jgi:uncharacterized RDD family membrane protein YckC